MAPTDALAALREAIRTRREELHLSQERLADRVAELVPGAPVDRDTIQYLETRRRSLPPREILEPIGAALGLSWDEIVGRL